MMAGPSVRVRMYDVGFGDCFLVFVGAPERDHTVLVDCGTHTAGKARRPFDEAVQGLLDDIEAEAGSRLDVVVATHRHRDHVHGFRHQRWEDIEVGEVWLPWTEHPNDPVAKRLRDRQSASAMRLGLALDGLRALDAEDRPAADRLAAAHAMLENSLTNEDAMDTLHHGFHGSPTRWFLEAAQVRAAETPRERIDQPDRPGGAAGPGSGSRPGQPGERAPTFAAPGLPGVTVHVLGPSRDEAVIRDMDPPDEEAYLSLGAADGMGGPGGPSLRPLFDPTWVIDERRWNTDPAYDHLRSKALGAVVNAARGDVQAVAAALEQSVNGTSLMVALEVGRAMLLFPGDAQWGTWNDALSDPRRRTVLSRTTFYKVGHHGSHNATPRSFVEGVLHDARAVFVSVAPTSIESWKHIPEQDLITALGTGPARLVVRSDEQAPDDPDLTTSGDGRWVELALTT
jgi:beta-lactamase superfamily II metal-dependent hydrolase